MSHITPDAQCALANHLFTLSISEKSLCLYIAIHIITSTTLHHALAPPTIDCLGILPLSRSSFCNFMRTVVVASRRLQTAGSPKNPTYIVLYLGRRWRMGE